jgi:flagellar biosynthesis/type III secretory pathway protein FliH
MTKKKFPSTIKYEKNNPAITFRIPLEDKQKITQLLKITGKSLSQIIRETIFYADKEYTEIINKARKEGFTEGFEKAKKIYEIWYTCFICEEKLTIFPNSEVHNAMIEYMREKSWGHNKYHEDAKKKRKYFKPL